MDYALLTAYPLVVIFCGFRMGRKSGFQEGYKMALEHIKRLAFKDAEKLHDSRN